MAKKKPDAPETVALSEIGATGLKVYGGRIQDEWLKELSGTKELKTYREMAENEAVIHACLTTFRQLIKQAPIRFEGGDDQTREFVQSLPGDMSSTWSTVLDDIMTMQWAGYSALEVVAKYRRGDEPGFDANGKRLPTSKHNDGMIGWRKMPIRSQESVEGWIIDDEGGVQGLKQRPAPKYDMREIPIEKLLLFKTDSNKGSPQGMSQLRHCFLSYYFLRKIRTNEAIGIDRDINGLPVIYAPAAVCSEQATGNEALMRDALKTIVTNIRVDSQAGVLLPGDRDNSGNRLYELTLLATNGRRNFDTGAVIDRYQRDIAIALLCDFLLLGHEKVGSFALASSKTTITAMAVAGWLDGIVEVFNRHAIPRILRLNGLPTKDAPRMVRGDIETPDLQELANYISAMVGCGAILPTPELEQHLLTVASLPTPSNEEGATVGKRDVAGLRALVAKASAIRMATATLRGQLRPMGAEAAA